MSITVNCDMCGKEQKPQDRNIQAGKQQGPRRLWSIFVTHLDYRATGSAYKGVQKKEHQICPECTVELLKEKFE